MSGNSQIRPNACTDSSSPMASPVKAAMQQIATPNTMDSTSMPTAGQKPFWNRNPTAYPTPRTIRIVTVIRMVSAVRRPASTAERAIGIDRSRSMTPFFSSLASAMAGAERRERRGLRDDPRDQEVDVSAGYLRTGIAPPKT